MKPLHDLSDDDLTRALGASRALDEPPADVVDRAIGLFRSARTAARPATDLPAAVTSALRRLVAVLSFDSAGADGLAFGMRSSAGAVRQLLFTVEGHDIDLRVTPGTTPQTFAVSGQVLGPEAAGRVRLESLRADAPVPPSDVALDEWGEFVLPAVPPGPYRVTLLLADAAIELPPLDIPYPG